MFAFLRNAVGTGFMEFIQQVLRKSIAWQRNVRIFEYV